MLNYSILEQQPENNDIFSKQPSFDEKLLISSREYNYAKGLSQSPNEELSRPPCILD
jgi:hypothetical protein